MSIKIKRVSSIEEHQNCLSIRKKVFIEEQGIPGDIEMDDDRVNATNFYALFAEECVGTARYRVTNNGIKLERFAVLKPYRNLGIGKALVKFILNTLNDDEIYLHAQESVVDFYTLLGFEKIGKRFFEADIPHWKMIRI
tara:strand:- start:734 stop:1150 length:417 start_codon:yes stop_codon:yes gene_type:complete